MLLVFVRLFLGPDLMDKIIAIDLLVSVGVAVIAADSILHHEPFMIDIALIISIIAFLSTVAFAMYYDKGKRIKKKLKTQKNIES